MASSSELVTWDMVPSVWLFSPEQERTWLREMAKLSPEPAEELERRVCVELPDCPPAWRYHDEYLAALAHRDDLVPVLVSSREQWNDRREALCEVVWSLMHRRPPTMAFCAVAVPRSSPLGASLGRREG